MAKRNTIRAIGIIAILLFPVTAMAQVRVGGFAGYYMPSDATLKEIYGSGGPIFGGSLSFTLAGRAEVGVEGSFYSAKGKMTFTEEEISLTLTPLAARLRLMLVSAGMATPYIGGGLDYVLFKEDEPERFEDVSDAALGFHVEGGLYLDLGPGFYLDFNARYVLATAKPFDEEVKLGGFRVGAGLGARF